VRCFLCVFFILFLLQGCFSSDTRPAWTGNSAELSFLGAQPFKLSEIGDEKFILVPSKDLKDSKKPEDFKNEQFDTLNYSQNTKNYLYALEELLKLRPELIEASTNVEEKTANIIGARSEFLPTSNFGLVNDQVLVSKVDSNRKTNGGYVDGFVDFNYQISDFGGRNANYRRALIDKKLAEGQFKQTVNIQAKKYTDLYFEYSLISAKQEFLEEFESELKDLSVQAEDRFLGGIATIFEINTIEQASLRLELKKSVFNQDLERIKSEFLSYFPFDLEIGSSVTFNDLTNLVIDNLDMQDEMFVKNSSYLEENINLLRAELALEEYFHAISEVSPETNARIRTKVFDMHEFSGDYEVVLTLQGSLGLYDGGSSNSRALSALKRNESAVFRKDATKSNNDSRLNTIKGQVNSVINRIKDIQELKVDYEEDLLIARERSGNINFVPGEIIAARERILEQNLSEIDNRISLSKLFSELLYLHGLYPRVLGFENYGKIY
jgi:hypothetical protein